VHSVRNVAFWFTKGADSFRGFVGYLFIFEPGSTKEGEVEGRSKPTNGFAAGWNYMGLSGWDLWKKHLENEGI
jgi:hypothetical protein